MILNYMRNFNTIEFLELWETLNNPNFKGVKIEPPTPLEYIPPLKIKILI